jgi:hypothetical protein
LKSSQEKLKQTIILELLPEFLLDVAHASAGNHAFPFWCDLAEK